MTKPWTAKEIAKAEKAIKAIEDGSAEYTEYETAHWRKVCNL